jgi:hypothetical protein
MNDAIAIWGFGCLATDLTKNEKFHAIWALVFPAAVIFYTSKVLFKLG